MDCVNTPNFISIQNNNIAYYREGKGETIIFIHGITTYSFIWRNVAPAFTEKYDVIVLDLLGNGLSDKPIEQDFSLKRQASIIYDFCKALDIEKVHLVCHDVGGGVGQIFACSHEKMLLSLALINSVAHNFWPVQPIITMRTPVLRQLAMAMLDLGAYEIIVKRGLYDSTLCTKELMKYFFKPVSTSIGKKSFLRFAQCLDNKNLISIEPQLIQLSTKTLIIRSAHDVYLSKNIALYLKSTILNSTLIEIENSGHFIQEDQTKSLISHLQYFLQNV